MPKKFSADLRAQAVRLAQQHMQTHAVSIATACDEVGPKVGVSPHTLRHWVQVARRDSQPTTQMSREELAGEVRQLRARLAEMERANEILKAASAFFAAELDRPGPR